MASKPASHLPPRKRQRTLKSRGTVSVNRDAPGNLAGESLQRAEEREQRYALILAGSNDALWDWDLRTGEVYRSARIKEILGFEETASDLTAEEWVQRIHADDRDRYQECLIEYLKGMTERLERRYRVRDAVGTYRCVMEHAKGLRDEGNRVYRIAGSLRDITQQVEAEEKLRCSERRYREIVAIASDRIWEMDSQLRFTAFSGAGADGVQEQDALGKSPWEVFGVDPVEDAQWGQLKALFERHQPFRNHLRSGSYSQGTMEYYRISGTPIFDDTGTFAGYYGVTTIETKTIAALKRAQKAEDFLRSAVNSISAGFAIYCEDGLLVTCNEPYRQIYSNVSDLLVPGTSLETITRAAFARRQYVDCEGSEDSWLEDRSNRYNKAPGSIEQQLADGRFILVTERRMPNGCIASLHIDITAQKHAEAAQRAAALEAQDANQAKSEFLASMSHELRTPLNAIIGFSELMRDGLFGPLGDERYQAYAEDIHLSGRHLLSIINDILDFAKIDSGRQQLVEKVVDLSAIVAESIGALLLQAEQEQVGLSSDSPPAPGFLLADETKIRQILMNLISNAIKFTPAGGRITVSQCIDPEGRLALKVTDTGVGMTAKEIPIALEPFRQLDGRLNRKYSGTGLGLPLTKRLVELHGGDLTIDSTPGQGTTVSAVFPANRTIAKWATVNR